MKAKFIVFDGIDGSGKSTILWNFAQNLSRKDKHFHFLITREPYKKREIREILKQESDPYTQKEKLTKLFIKDRKEHINEIILPVLNKNIFVLSDRYKYSTLAYQSAQGISIEKLINMHAGLIIPDIVFILDVPVDVAAKRMKDKKRDKEHKFEANLQFLEKVRQNYLKLPKILPNENIQIIDATEPIERVTDKTMKIFESNFPRS